MKIIAESAFNHNGSMVYLKDLAKASKASSADYFTVQVMIVDAFCSVDYDKYDLYKNTEFSKKEWLDFFDYCRSQNINLIPCILEEESFDLCFKYGFELIKLHATDLTNEPLLKTIHQAGVNVILETQCATLLEVNFAVQTIGTDRIKALFTGYSNYPTEIEDLNLNTIDFLRQRFALPIGYADHSLDTVNIPLMILAKGCDYIEKHITLTRNNRNLDYQVSLYPFEFKSMVANIHHYTAALGYYHKHPTRNEASYRAIMYKKVLPNKASLLRSNSGYTFFENRIRSLDKNRACAAVIARLKSKRLKEKVLKPFFKNEMVIDLYSRLAVNTNWQTILATSNLTDDDRLVEVAKNKGATVFRGDAISVIDRMLSLALHQNVGCIFRVTGDNPFTDPSVMEEMLVMMKDDDLDYVRVNNLPFGLGAELFSTRYLWNLYLKLETSIYSEYLTWYVLNDNDVKAGCIDFDYSQNEYLGYKNLSVDYSADFEQCLKLISLFDVESFREITLEMLVSKLSSLSDIDKTSVMKLPNGRSVVLEKYLDDWKNKNYTKRKRMTI